MEEEKGRKGGREGRRQREREDERKGEDGEKSGWDPERSTDTTDLTGYAALRGCFFVTCMVSGMV